MSRIRPLTLVASAAAAPLIALAVAACSNGGGGAGTGLGQILVNSQGRTLYLFQKDTSPTSTCTGACATSWPPLRTSGQPAVGSGANAALLGTTPRSDGGPQLTYNGHPLYLFFQDQKPGDTNGEGVNAFGASWFALSPSGNQVTAAASGGSASSSGGAGGYARRRARAGSTRTLPAPPHPARPRREQHASRAVSLRHAIDDLLRPGVEVIVELRRSSSSALPGSAPLSGPCAGCGRSAGTRRHAAPHPKFRGRLELAGVYRLVRPFTVKTSHDGV